MRHHVDCQQRFFAADCGQKQLPDIELNQPRGRTNVRRAEGRLLRKQIDRNVLKKVLEGLLKNAVENTPDEGCIEISVAESGNDVRARFPSAPISMKEQNVFHPVAAFSRLILSP